MYNTWFDLYIFIKCMYGIQHLAGQIELGDDIWAYTLHTWDQTLIPSTICPRNIKNHTWRYNIDDPICSVRPEQHCFNRWASNSPSGLYHWAYDFRDWSSYPQAFWASLKMKSSIIIIANFDKMSEYINLLLKFEEYFY